ncbi:hypothetical protein [Streptomyces sp. SS]|uniref:hypothetical protein n=1 Tax=Streptomyces sp. SS TaxID=260742 RepID=UPI0002E9D81B|nr:hypothetical protein [Streptomyces sp. SS]
MPDHYAFRVATRRGDLHLIWRLGEGNDHDALAVDDGRRLLAFHEAEALQGHCEREGWDLVADAESVLDLEAVRESFEEAARDPRARTVPTGLLLEAWNFFEDLARSVDTTTVLPAQGAVHDAAYDRFFDAADGGVWSDEEAAAAWGLLRAGLDVWEEAVRDALVPDAALLTRTTESARSVPPS